MPSMTGVSVSCIAFWPPTQLHIFSARPNQPNGHHLTNSTQHYVHNVQQVMIQHFNTIYLMWHGLGNKMYTVRSSLTGLNLSASCWGGCLNWVNRHLFWCVHPPTAWYTWFYKKLPVSQCQVYWAPSVFYFSDNSLVLCYSSCFCIVFPLWL